MNATLINSIRKLTPKQRIKLIEDIWGTFQDSNDQPTLTAAQEKHLDQRLAAHKAHPERSMSFDAFKRKMADATAAFKQRDKSRSK